MYIRMSDNPELKCFTAWINSAGMWGHVFASQTPVIFVPITNPKGERGNGRLHSERFCILPIISR